MGMCFFFDAQIDANGCWVIPVGTLSAFVKTAQVPNCPQLHVPPYASVAYTSVRPAEANKSRLFCGVAIALASKRNHVAVHLQKGEVVADPRMRGEAKPCGFRASIVRKKINSRCLCVVTLKHTSAMRKQENMPREYPIPRCYATPWILNQNSLGTLPSHCGTKYR